MCKQTFDNYEKNTFCKINVLISLKPKASILVTQFWMLWRDHRNVSCLATSWQRLIQDVIISRRKVQKLRDQSQYISKNVRALQYWRWACGTCCKQYHMLFYIQMAVVSTAILILFSPSLSFFLEIKVQIYIYFHNKCQYINQFPPKP